MRGEAPKTPAAGLAALKIVKDLFDGSLLAVYLHGSAVSGGLRPQSDVDLLVATERPMTDAMRSSLLAALMRTSGRHPASPDGPCCIDLMVFLKSHLSASAYPARSEFIYGEWLRDEFEADEVPSPVSDPEVTLVLAQARQYERALVGPSAAELLPQMPNDHVRRAMRDVLPSLFDNLTGDERHRCRVGYSPPAGRCRYGADPRSGRVSWPNQGCLGNPPSRSAPSGNLPASQDI